MISTRRRLGRIAVVAAVAAVAAAALGCRVNKDDLKRWEKTVNGPDKLVAVLTHDKYERDLRVEAAWSLIEMRKRGGQAIGLTRLIEELDKLPVTERREILDGVWKRLQPMVLQPIQPAGEGRFSDPSVVYKDATFALYTDEKLDLDPKLRDEMTRALTEWAVGKDGDPAEKRLAAFETRMDNAAQAYGVEQVLRKLGLPAATRLPKLMTAPSAIKNQRLDSIARIVVDVKPAAGDKGAGEAYDKARDELSTHFADILKQTIGDGYVNAVKPEIDEALKKAPNGKQVLDNPDNYKKYMNDVRNERLTSLFAIAKQVGRKPVVDVLIATAQDPKADAKHRALSLAALEGNVDTSNDAQMKAFLAIAKSDAPDEVKLGSLNRMNAYPPDVAIKAYYDLFESPNWKVRYGGALRVLDLLARVGDRTKTNPKEFLAKLPATDKSKFALGEPSAYGDALHALPKELGAKAALDDALKSERLGAQLTALGWYLTHGTKDDLPALAKLEADKSPVPKCKEDEECGWEKPGCPVPKAGKPDEVDYKSIATVGDYVQHCVKVQIEQRAKAPKPEGSK
ncbi:MAG: hypothetical protein HYV09_35585 [Deltaproteobacteria bacterium]|nr:hypothetical protein [Deltaproteobacteria bacterium]